MLLLLPLLLTSCDVIRYLFPNSQREYILEVDNARVVIDGTYTSGGVDMNLRFYDGCFLRTLYK